MYDGYWDLLSEWMALEKNMLIEFLVCLWKLGEWRDVEWLMVGASNMDLIRMLYACVPVICLLITGKIYSGADNRGDPCGTVVKALCYKSEGHWFDPSWCHWNFSLT